MWVCLSACLCVIASEGLPYLIALFLHVVFMVMLYLEITHYAELRESKYLASCHVGGGSEAIQCERNNVALICHSPIKNLIRHFVFRVSK